MRVDNDKGIKKLPKFKLIMKLFLASEAGDPKTFEDIQKFVGGFKDKKIAFVVTASNG